MIMLGKIVPKEYATDYILQWSILLIWSYWDENIINK